MKRFTPANVRQSQSGFTLLEISAAMGVLTILAAGIFSLTAGSFQLTEELSEFQKRNVLRKRFIELCRTNLEDVPGHARVEINYDDSSQYNVAQLSIVDDPFAFTFGGNPANVRRVILETGVSSGGFLQANLLYLNEEENAAYEDGNRDTSAIQRRVVLLRRLAMLEWRLYDPRQGWLKPELWTQGNAPTLVEMSLAMEGETIPERAVFWIPPEKPVPAGRRGADPDEDEDESEDDDDDEDEDEDESDADSAVPVRTP